MNTNLYYKILPEIKLYILKPNNHQIKNYNPLTIVTQIINKSSQIIKETLY
jgi:hypothetical protein